MSHCRVAVATTDTVRILEEEKETTAAVILLSSAAAANTCTGRRKRERRNKGNNNRIINTTTTATMGIAGQGTQKDIIRTMAQQQIPQHSTNMTIITLTNL